MSVGRRLARVLLAAALVAGVTTPLTAAGPAQAATLPNGFQEQIVYSGLTMPVNVEFSPDGRVLVAQKNGVIKVFDDLADPTADVFADLSDEVHDQWDRGLLGMTLAPNFPVDPYVYVLYSYDFDPRTGSQWHDVCPSPTNGECVITARLSRLRVDGNHATGEQVLVEDWCQQYPSHSIGDLRFGADGKLYVTGGDGASFSYADTGENNTCGDPSGEGGSLRSQDVRTLGDPTGLNGSLLRIEPATGAAVSTNPLYASTTDPGARRIVATGMRNPFRFTIRPGTSEVWLGDVGWNTWEEIDRVVSPTAGVTNFGWPCYEGMGQLAPFVSAGLSLCENFSAAQPYYTYDHAATVGTCTKGGGSAVTGLAFYPQNGGNYPDSYRGALFFADYSRKCIFVMPPATAGGLPDPAKVQVFSASVSAPTDLAIGPGGDLYYADQSGTIRRIRYFAGNQPPIAVLGASSTAGALPLAVNFDGSASTDADPADQNMLRYSWNFGDGSDPATGAQPSHTYARAGTYTATLVVTDTLGATDTKTVQIVAGNDRPTGTITSPSAGLTWSVGQTISFGGTATDPQDGSVPAAGMVWDLVMLHCYTPSDCHRHPVRSWTGVSGGSFVAPDHEYPSYLELTLTATDSGGLTSVVTTRLSPKSVDLSFATNPAGLNLAVGSGGAVGPIVHTAIVGSHLTVSAPTPQQFNGKTYSFLSWSDGGTQTHVLTAPASPTSYSATYVVDNKVGKVTGKVTQSGTGDPVAGAQVTLNPGGFSTVTAADGTYQIANLLGGTYTATASMGNGNCAPPKTGPALILAPNGTVTGNLALDLKPDAFGYTCMDAGAAFVAAANPLALTGDDAVSSVDLPFSFPFYGSTFSKVWIDTNGYMSFVNPGSSRYANGTLPRPAAPNAAVYAFHDDLVVDAQSSVRTTSSGSQFIVEWRNVRLYTEPDSRVTFEVILNSDGTIRLNYQGLDTVAEQGSSATAGIENGKGTSAVRYSVNGPTLRSGVGVLFTPPGGPPPPPPQVGSVSGVVRDSSNAPLAGATVTLAPAGLLATTGTDGSYSFAGVTQGAYTVTASYHGAVSSAPVTVDGAETVNLSVAAPPPGAYAITSSAQAFLAATDVLPLTGDDAVSSVDLPFSFSFYGSTYSKLWIDTNGVVSFVDPKASHSGDHGSIPTGALPNAAIYAFHDDLVVDAAASVRTAVIGTPGSRRYVIEWRDVFAFPDSDQRFSVEVILEESSGIVTLNYSGLDTSRERGAQATVGVENATGTAAVPFSVNQPNLRSGTAVIFTPVS